MYFKLEPSCNDRSKCRRLGSQARTAIKTVGAGLLAKAVCQSLKMLADLAPLRASPLPHLGCISRLEPSCIDRSKCRRLESQARTAIKTVGAGLPAKAVGQSLKMLADLAPSRASPLPHLGCISRLESSCAERSKCRRIGSQARTAIMFARLRAEARRRTHRRASGVHPCRRRPARPGCRRSSPVSRWRRHAPS